MLVARKIKGFELLSRHFVDGLTSEDFSSYLGQPVPAFYLSDFPHWTKLNKFGVSLSNDQELERARAINEALKNAYSSFFPNRKNWWRASQDRCEVMAPFQNSAVNYYLQLFHHHFWEFSKNYFYDVISNPTSVYGECMVESGARPSPYIFPQPIEEHRLTIDDYVPLYRNLYPFVLLNAPYQDPRSVYATRTGLPVDVITRHPKNDCLFLMDGLHEMRHLRQLRTDNNVYDATRHAYYRELDADLFARYTIARSPCSHEALHAELMTRYIETLTSVDEYWFAPALEAIENKSPVPSYQEVVQTVATIKTGLMDGGLPVRSLTHVNGELQLPDWLSWRDQNLIAKPQKAYGKLKALVNCGVFEHRPLAQHTAKRIIDAVNYFSPRLISG